MKITTSDNDADMQIRYIDKMSHLLLFFCFFWQILEIKKKFFIMPACPRDNQYSSLPPPGFNEDILALKRVKLIELLEKVIDKCQREPQFIEQQSKQTDLLVEIAQLTLSVDNKREFLNNILTIGQDLLTDENQINDLTNESLLPLNEGQNPTVTTLLNTDPDGDFSLDDLANEYLQNEPTPVSSNDKSTTPSEPDLTLDDLSKNYLSSPSSTPPSSVLTNLVILPPPNESIIIKPPLESILFSNRLSSNDAADEADCIWKEKSSPFGQIFCTKTNEHQIIPTKRISTCLLDRSLYERLTRLIILLPKQCIRNSVQQFSFRHNGQQPNRPPRPNHHTHRPSNRPSFTQNALHRFPNSQNPRQHPYQNYPNQLGYQEGYFVDPRQQQQPNRYAPQVNFAPYPGGYHQQQQNRYPSPPNFIQHPADHYQQQQNGYPPPPNFVQHPVDHQQQQKGPQKDNSYTGGHQQQKKKPPNNNNQQTSNQYRGNKKGSGGGGGGKSFPFT
jgi:hypothetical protein